MSINSDLPVDGDRCEMVCPFGEHLSTVPLRESGSSKPGGRLPLSVGLEIATAIQTLVYQTQQLHSVCRSNSAVCVCVCVRVWQTHYASVGDEVGGDEFYGALRGTRRSNGGSQTRSVCVHTAYTLLCVVCVVCFT